MEIERKLAACAELRKVKNVKSYEDEVGTQTKPSNRSYNQHDNFRTKVNMAHDNKTNCLICDKPDHLT